MQVCNAQKPTYSVAYCISYLTLTTPFLYVCVCACAGVPNIVLARHHTNQDQLHLFFRTELTGEQMMIELATNTKVFLWTGIIISTCAVGVLSYAFYR